MKAIFTRFNCQLAKQFRIMESELISLIENAKIFLWKLQVMNTTIPNFESTCLRMETLRIILEATLETFEREKANNRHSYNLDMFHLDLSSFFTMKGFNSIEIHYDEKVEVPKMQTNDINATKSQPLKRKRIRGDNCLIQEAIEKKMPKTRNIFYEHGVEYSVKNPAFAVMFGIKVKEKIDASKINNIFDVVGRRTNYLLEEDKFILRPQKKKIISKNLDTFLSLPYEAKTLIWQHLEHIKNNFDKNEWLYYSIRNETTDLWNNRIREISEVLKSKILTTLMQ